MKGYLTGLIEGNLTSREENKRNYIGASLIGSPCWRQVWYSYKNYEGSLKTNKTKRTLEMGKRIEGMIIGLLQDAGIKLILPDNFNHNLELFDKEIPLLRGHPDAIIDNEDAILEIKTANDSSFIVFKKKGLKLWSERYYSQIQCYMGMGKYEKAYLLCINKDTSELWDECIEFDEEYYESLKEKVRVIKDAEDAPPKLNPSPFYFVCRMCEFNQICHGEK